jgi:hypothetical protein
MPTDPSEDRVGDVPPTPSLAKVKLCVKNCVIVIVQNFILLYYFQ